MIRIFTDGAARGNPGPAAAGFVVFKKDVLLKKVVRYIGKSTNNIAEYKAIIMALENMKENAKAEIFSDSKLVVNQINGTFKVKKEHLQVLNRRVRELSAKKKVSFSWVPRETPEIIIVDSLINLKLDERK